MKKHYFLALILAFASVASAFAVQPHLPTQNGYPVLVNFGYKKIATPTVTINNTIIDLADYLPAGTIGFKIRCASGSFVIGHPDNIATGTNRVGDLVSAGEIYQWNGFAGEHFNGGILGTASSTIIVFDAAWGQYEK